MKAVVFLGPSLLHSEASAILNAELRGPAAAGDVLSAALGAPPAIVLIDGYFEAVPAVWHKEILFAIERGVPVYGAASMGALRAAELHTFGMIGVGRIFERYRTGELEDDDEVAVVHAPGEMGYRPISEAMVSLRDALARATREGVIEPSEHDALVRAAKALFYPERLWDRIASRSGLSGAKAAALLAWVERVRPNTKRDDAIAVLEKVRDDLLAGVAPAPCNFELERSIFWEELVESVVGGVGGGGAVPSDAVVACAKLRAAPGLLRDAMLRHVVRSDAMRRGRVPDPLILQNAFDDFRRQRGLHEVEQLSVWLETHSLDAETLIRIITERVLIEEVLSSEGSGVDRALVDELKLAGEWKAVSQDAQAQHRAAMRIGMPSPTPADAGVSETTLLAWYSERFGPISGELSSHVRALGFVTVADFMVAMTRAYLARHA